MSLTYKEMQHALMEGLRLCHFPVAVTFLRDEQAIERFCTHADVYVPANPLTFCQAELAARMQGKTVLMRPELISCLSAQLSFGLRDISDKDIALQKRNTRSEEQARRFLADRPKLDKGLFAAAGIGPLADVSEEPSAVHFFCDPMQAYHILVDYMVATDLHPLRPYQCTGSAACGGSVFSYLEKTANMVTACAGSYSSGKTERGELNVMLPGCHIEQYVERFLERAGQNSGSSVTRPGDPFPGADICGNCPLIRFNKLEKGSGAA